MKIRFLSLLTVLLASGLSVPAANIAWVSFHSADDTPSANAAAAGFTNAPDAGYTAFLRAHGHTVTRFVGVDNLDTQPDLITALNTNDLVIISRSGNSGWYQAANETAAWNTSITKPTILVNGYVLRNARLGFTTGDTMVDVNSNPMRLKVNSPLHPIFSGVALDANNVMVNPYAERVVFTNATTGATNLQNGISVNTSAPIAGANVLAVVGTTGDAALNGMVIGEYPQGLTNSTARDAFGEKRLVFLTGSRENGITSEGAGIFDLLPDGQTLLLNAVTYMTSHYAPICTTPLIGGTNLAVGDSWSFSAGVIGDSPLTYQWYKNDQALPSGTSATLNFPSLAASDAGAYYLIVTNATGSATSTVASLEFAVYPPASITNSIISYWPLDTVLGTKTPDLVSGYDMNLIHMGDTNVMPGKFGNAFNFDNASQTFLVRSDNPGEALPIYQYPNFTVSLWVQGNIQSDHRIFCESSTTNNNPLFDLGTDNGGVTSTVDVYIRNDSGATPGDHRHSTGIAFDYINWHNVVYVQRDVGNGTMKAQLWIDGVLDPVVLYPTRPLTPNVTAIGGIRRASDSAWYSGLIDEVAVWNRALSPQEIGILQVTSITNPPTRLQPLAINSFHADLPAVVKGDSTILRWDVSKDASQVTITPLGDVTGQTSVGIGSQSITVNQATTYVLTVNRGTSTLSATTSVAVVDGVAPGWALLDNFDRYPLGNLFDNGYWADVSGASAQVVSSNANPAIRTASGIVYLPLQQRTVMENQERTLFFRLIPGPSTAAGVTNILGLTDKSQRGFGDEYLNIGPVLYVAPFTNSLIGGTTNAWYIGARNGYFGNNTSPDIVFPGPALEEGAVYDIWLDVTNEPTSGFQYLSDYFSVYIQKEGDSTRTALFTDYQSDRDPFYVDAVLGGMLPNLDKLVVMGNSGTLSATFDDFYLSTTGYNTTVPREYAFTGGVPGNLTIGAVGNQIEIRWTSGTLQEATSLSGPWNPVSGNPQSPLLVTPTGTSKFYRTQQ